MIDRSELFNTRYFQDASGLSGTRRSLIQRYLNDRALHKLPTSILFDPKWYLRRLRNDEIHVSPLLDFLKREHNSDFDPHALFDLDYYVSQSTNHEWSATDPVSHYLYAGSTLGLKPHPLFDPEWYIRQYPDVRDSGVDPLVHYLTVGAAAGHSPHYLFDPEWYAKNAGVPVSEGLVHFLKDTEALHSPHPLFDPAWYLKQNKDVVDAQLNPLVHYLVYGWREGRSPHPLFDVRTYRDSATSKRLTIETEPLAHYLETGDALGLQPHILFDPTYYRRVNPDVASGTQRALMHFLMYGGRERRDPHFLFKSSWYMDRNQDVAKDGWNPLVHYVLYGSREGRSIHPDFDAGWYTSKYGVQFQDHIEVISDFIQNAAVFQRLPSPRVGAALTLLDATHPTAEIQAVTLKRPVQRLVAIRGQCLFVSHRFGGGTAVHLSALRESMRDSGFDVLTLTFEGRNGIYLNKQGHEERMPGTGQDALAEAVRRLASENITFVHYHQVMTGIPEIRKIASTLKVPYYVTVHDFYYICPRVNLIDASGRYCGQPLASQCNRCVSISGTYPGLEQEFAECDHSVRVWRDKLARWLEGAEAVITPSQDVADRLAHHGRANLVVRPHPESYEEAHLMPPPGSGRLRVGLIGALGPHKGADLLLDCARDAYIRGLPIEFVVIGEIAKAERFDALSNVHITGRYPRHLLAKAAKLEPCHAALFLSVWPETYCYVLSEAVSLGLFPIALDIGAVGERIRQMGWGHLIRADSSPSEINDELMKLPAVRRPPPAGLRINNTYEPFYEAYYLGVQQ